MEGVVFKPFHFIEMSTSPVSVIEKRQYSGGGNMFGGLSIDVIIVGVIVVTAVSFIVWVQKIFF